MLNSLRRKIDSSLASFLTQIEKTYKIHLVNPILYESIREFSLREGKRIRPLLFILSYKGYLPSPRKVTPSLYNASTCIEFLHNFMLIHDDIIDCSDMRRGKPTMHRLLRKTIATPNPDKLGTDLAIIAGDIVYAMAIDAFLSMKEDPYRKERALRYFVQTAAFTAMGEFIDTLHGVDTLANVKEKDVFLNYSLKTARYTFDCPLVTGAILAGAPQREINALAQFGILIGQAFQIQDDIIGIFETEQRIGKSILSDLEEQKKTLLVIHAYRILKGKKAAAFLKIFLKRKKNHADLEAVKKILVDAGSLAYALDAVRSHAVQANAILKRLRISPKYRDLIGTLLFDLFQQSQAVADTWDVPVNVTSIY
ncbi:MAG: polyprenyl synthetase family protein [Candidatus Omnitrophica bacterium]|nr:polyprenyl synthetase family protein [Candidatus Omnitrophota bacterium]